MCLINVENLYYRYPSGLVALKGVSLKVSAGEKIAVIGQNGAGKTTLAKHFNGLLKPTAGKVEIRQTDTREKTTAQLARWVGFIFQNPDDQLFKNSIREELAFGPKQIGFSREKTEEMIEKTAELVEIKDILRKNPYDISHADRKFVSIASVLTMDPQIIILDEPTAGQSHDKIRLLEKIIACLHEQGKTLVVITHDMEFVAGNSSWVVVMKDGTILTQGRTTEVFSRRDALAESFLRPPYLAELCLDYRLPVTFEVDRFVEAFLQSL